ncbi:hypothetical protein [Actinoplanes sp. NPDC026623]|uniref:hypothetical protein n=1 Tax=Actinoplanes sp. NPDC026623 TaxID=3155610 RepID=UPI0033FCA8A8
MELILVLEAAPVALVLSIALVVLVRRQAALGRRGAAAIAGVGAMLILPIIDIVLTVLRLQGLRSVSAGGPWADLWWIDLVNLMLLPAKLAAFPLLVWAVLAGRSPRRAGDPAVAP